MRQDFPGSGRAELLREAFDRSFAEAPARAPTDLDDLLCIRIAGAPHALRVAELSGIFADVHVAPLPTRIAELRGIASMKGAILPVYDLRALLGYRPDAAPRWLAVARAVPVGVAFDAFERHVRVRRDAVVPRRPGDAAGRHVRDVVHVEGQLQSIVSMSSVLEAITARARGGAREEG